MKQEIDNYYKEKQPYSASEIIVMADTDKAYEIEKNFDKISEIRKYK